MTNRYGCLAVLGFLAITGSTGLGCNVSSSEFDEVDSGAAVTCEPGNTQDCLCGEEVGFQLCNENGDGWMACDCGGIDGPYCYDFQFLAPSEWGEVITEGSDDEDSRDECIQYSVALKPESPVSGTKLCLYVDIAESPDQEPVCGAPRGDNPASLPVTLCQGDHTLDVRVEPSGDTPLFECSAKQTQVSVFEDPTCDITVPVGLSTDMADPTLWSEPTIDFEVTTSGAKVDLVIGGTTVDSRAAVDGVASFGAVRLGSDGPMLIRARCYQNREEEGDAWSPDYRLDKDVVPPTVTIVSPPETGNAFGEDECPFTLKVTGVESGNEICANYVEESKKLAADICAVSAGENQETDLEIPCQEGVDLELEAWSRDAHGNLGHDSIIVSSDPFAPVVVLDTPDPNRASVYNKADDVLDPDSPQFEVDIVACIDAQYPKEAVQIYVDKKRLTELDFEVVPSVGGSGVCDGYPYQIAFDRYAFSQPGYTVTHKLEVTVSDAYNTGSSGEYVFNSDTVPPVLTFLQPENSFFPTSYDYCDSTTDDQEVYAKVRAVGLEVGEEVLLTVLDSGGDPISHADNPYSASSNNGLTADVDFGNSCPSRAGGKGGVITAEGENTLRATASDSAGNPAVAEFYVTRGTGAIISPVVPPGEPRVIIGPANDMDGNTDNADYRLRVAVEVDESLGSGGSVRVTLSSAAGGGWFGSTRAIARATSCGSSPCVMNFDFDIPETDVERDDIKAELEIDPAGGINYALVDTEYPILVDISAPEDPAGTPLPFEIQPSKRRAAEVILKWTDVEDPESGLLKSWDVRCVTDKDIASNWDDAQVIDFSGEPAPAAAGTAHSLTVSQDAAGNRLRAGNHYYSCGIRGKNQVGIEGPVAVFWDDEGDGSSDFAIDATFDEDIGFRTWKTGGGADILIQGYTQSRTTLLMWPSVAPAGDLNGDGKDDLLAGYQVADWDDGAGKYLYSGKAGISMGSASGPGAVQQITCGDNSFGGGMAGIGDFNGDGYPDFAVGAPAEGRVYIFFGGSAFTGTGLDCEGNASVVVQGDTTSPYDSFGIYSWFGMAIAPLGDFDNDDYADFAIGAPYEPGTGGSDGAVYVVFGRAVSSPPLTVDLVNPENVNGTLHMTGNPGAMASAGRSIAGANFDNEPYTDLVFSEGLADGQSDGSGYLSMVHIVNIENYTLVKGNSLNQISLSSPPSGVQVITIETPDPHNISNFGHGLTPIDYDADGYMDLAVGALSAEESGTPSNAGEVYLFLNDGSGNIATTQSDYLSGTTAFDYLGLGMAGAYDFTLPAPAPWRLNGVALDGADTDQAVFAGASQEDNLDAAAVGYGALWYAGADDAHRTVSSADLFFAPPAGAVMYNWVSYVGDLNGDGYVDLAVGDSGYGTGGRVHFYY